jgi:hypothetical protein
MNKWGQVLITILCFIALIKSEANAQRASAEYISSIDPPSLISGENVKDGVQELIYHDNILFVIDVWAGIQVVDVSDIYNPKEIGRYQNDHRARNLFIQGKYGFLSDELEGVHILDISNPRSIVRLGKIETTGDAWWVVANYPYVYVAEEKNGVQVYDVSDPSLPKPLGKYDTHGWAWGLEIRGDLIFTADKTGGLQIIDFTDKNNPVLKGQFQEPTQAKSIFIEENLLYLTDGPNGLFILDISNPKFPALINKISTEGFIYDVFKGGKYLYMANESKRRLEIINLTDINNPTREATYDADDKIFGVWKEDVYVFVAANNKTLILRHNSPPVLAEIDPQEVAEVQLLTITPQGYDPDGDQVYYKIKNLPEGATFDSLSGLISWTPTYEQSGTYENITLRIIEKTASQLYSERSFAITVDHVNRAPSLPEVENYSVNENNVLTFTINEGSDPDIEDKGKLRYSVENMPAGAKFDSLTLTFSWTPTFEQSGTYVLDFIVKDPPGALDRDASTITVVHIDRKPELNAIADQTTDENSVIEFTVVGADPDKEDKNSVSFLAKNLPKGANFNPQTRTFSWTPGYDQSGSYPGIQFIMIAGGLSDTISTSINVNHVSRPPSLADIGNKPIDESQLLTFKISGSDTDTEDLNNLKYRVENLPNGAKFNPDSLVFSWTPGYDQSGTYSGIKFTVTDASGLEDSKAIEIVVNHVNRPPVHDAVTPVTSPENEPISITVSGSDPDAEDQNNLTYSVNPMPEGASFENNTLIWTPSYDQSGEYVIDFTISDGQLSNTQSSTITITHVNRSPAIEIIPPQNVNENEVLEFKVVGSDPDKEDAGKWKIAAEQLPEGATFIPETATFNWTPNFDQAGNYTIRFTNTDETGLSATQEVQITVNHVNRTPVLDIIEPQTGQENSTITFIVPAGIDPDTEDAQKLTYKIENLPEGAVFDETSRTLTWTPGFDQSGEYELIVECSDGEFTVTKPLKVSITHINRPPEIGEITNQSVDENSLLSLSIDYNDPDKEDEGKLQISVSNLPTGAQFDNQSGTLSWTPNYDQAGSYDGLNIIVTDPAGAKSEKAFAITVNNINRAPVLGQIPAISGTENLALAQQFTAEDPDQEDQGKLQFSSSNLPQGASLNPASGAFSWTPDYTQAGDYSLNIQIKDPAGLSAESSVNITIANVNRAPVIQNIAGQVVDENNSLSVSASGTDEDTDDQLTYSAEGLPSGAAIDENSGTITWTPDYDQSGNYNITVKVSDGEAEASTSFGITVNNVNRTPSIEGGGSVSVEPGETATFSFSASDPDNDQLRFESNDLPSGANLNASTGDFSWTPGDGDIGSHTFTVLVSDGTDTDQVSSTVTVNEPPAAPENPQDQN